MIFEYAAVHLLDSPYFLDNDYDYFIPSELRDSVARGGFVTVPFGTSNRAVVGIVTELKERPQLAKDSCKPIFFVCDDRLTLSDEMLSLARFIKGQTLCTLGEAVRAIMPSSIISRVAEIYSPTPDFDKDLTQLDETTRSIYETIQTKGYVRSALLARKFGAGAVTSLKKLRECGAIFRNYELLDSGEKTENFYSLAIPTQDVEGLYRAIGKRPKLRSAMHIEIVKTLAESPMSEEELIAATGASRAQIKAVLDKGLIHKEKKHVDRASLESYMKEPKKIELNDEQQRALETLASLAATREPKAALLHGVTGSGKTCVMMKLIDRVLEDGRGVIVLLPEISLTPQTLTLFCSRYGNRVAVIHSALSAGERFDTYNKIKEGKTDVVIGTRSAIFAPLRDLGLIIIDEEQEHTYKSDMSPKYHTKDIARFRCAHNGALMLLASATPSLESYRRAEEGKYTLVKLTNRFGEAKLPRVTICDMRPELQSGNTSPIGSLLARRLVENKAAGGQSILFINRRGYNNFLSCRSCGEAVRCPECSVSMTYHTIGRGYEQGELRCHWCGRRFQPPTECPTCHSPHVARIGYGTQRIEQELSLLLPDATILRMDTDTASTKGAYESMLGDFREHKADILLGTQMVTKGHDFPDVTLVGVLLADASLYLDDYRANERTFAMLTQVIGRAGRANMKGEAIIQTNNPENECIKLACAQDYEAFYRSEIRLRKLLVFPPYCDVVSLTLTSSDERELLMLSEKLSKTLKELTEGDYSHVPILTFGPFEAPVYKVDGKYRMRMIAKCRLNKDSRMMFAEILSKFSHASKKTVTLSIDFNPSNL